jgi:hypothetical protein
VYRDAVILEAGPGHRFDLTFRSLVVAPQQVAGPDRADLHVIDRPDGPVLAPTSEPEVLSSRGPERLGPRLLRPHPGASQPVSVLVDELRQASERARATGISAGSVVLDLGVDEAPDADRAQELLDATALIVALGHPVAVGVDSHLGSPVAVVVAAMVAGARLLRLGGRGTDVRTVRRAADLTEALLVERSGAGVPS